LSSIANGQSKKVVLKNSQSQHSFYLKIHIDKTLPLKDSLVISFSRNQTFSRAIYDGGYYVFPLNSIAPFEMCIKDVYDVGRLSLYSSEISDSYLPTNQMVEPGDSISMEICLRDDGTSNVKFTGRGSSKYVLGKMMHEITSARKDLELQTAMQKKNAVQAVKEYDSLLLEQIKLLNDFCKRLNQQVYKIWKADAIAETSNQQLRILSLAYSTADSQNKAKWKREIDKLLSKTNLRLSSQNTGLSTNFVEWQYEKTKWTMVYEKNKNYKPWEFTGNNDSFEFIDLYKRLKKNYFGSLRENLLTYGLLNSSDINMFFGGCATEDFTWCLKDAFQLIKSPGLKSLVKEKLEKFGRGSPIFNFQLATANGELVTPTDFKGKTVLIEIWSVGCGACHDFIKEFERKIYPDIKNRDDIKVISFCTETDKSRWLKASHKYSLPGFINVYSEKGPRDPLMVYYSATFYPFILLVDGEGKIISTMQNCDQLAGLLRKQMD
jgi:hypothetical protein